jgi:hypothetical protein
MTNHFVRDLAIALLTGGYFAWVATEWRQLRHHGKSFISYLWYCSVLQERHWCSIYTKRELENWNDKSRKQYPKGVEPSVPWYEVKYNLWNLWDDFLTPYSSLKHFFKNLIYYAPLLWNDSWFDHTFLLAWIERKCRRDADMYKKHGHLVSYLKTAKDLEEVADICNHLQNEHDYYDEAALRAHDRKWGKWPMRFKKISGTSTSRLVGERAKVKTPRQKVQEHKERMAIYYLIESRKRKDTRRLGTLFHRIRCWWD